MGKQKARRREASIARHERTNRRDTKATRKELRNNHERGAHDNKPEKGCEACLNMPFTQLRELVDQEVANER
ncbi:hypothetical protein LCGC14_1424420 [marine sediment metagenome]|uniref:Uncharacterized protein n=1 Tax=marine sediment metagenome TaxID=412755 RepID=A0A0F9KBH4_9ZZZZ